jgi:hypothetical protein
LSHRGSFVIAADETDPVDIFSIPDAETGGELAGEAVMFTGI